MTNAPFVAATWNAAGGTSNPPSLKTYERILDGLVEKNVSVLALQETDDPDFLELVRRAGFHVNYVRPQYAIAFDPDRWQLLNEGPIDLAPHHLYNRVGGQKNAHTMAAWAYLLDRLDGSHELTTMSYHLPASVQVANKPKNRIAATRESAATWRRVVFNDDRFRESDAFLFMGDDNIDERLNHGPWKFMRFKATGLRQVQAPKGTHGNRKIDDMRIRGLVPGHAEVLPGGGDHRIHLRHFSWKR